MAQEKEALLRKIEKILNQNKFTKEGNILKGSRYSVELPSQINHKSRELINRFR